MSRHTQLAGQTGHRGILPEVIHTVEDLGANAARMHLISAFNAPAH